MIETAHPHYKNAVYKQHHGGDQPEGDYAQVLPEYRGEATPGGVRIACAMAARLDWSHDGGNDDIVGYWLLYDPDRPTRLLEE